MLGLGRLERCAGRSPLGAVAVWLRHGGLPPWRPALRVAAAAGRCCRRFPATHGAGRRRADRGGCGACVRGEQVVARVGCGVRGEQ
eukprot:354008-Chlamydomonas_euryale.AAC.1